MEARTGDPAEFLSHPRWQRFIIALAGPAMNILLAIALLTGVFMVRYEHPYFLDQPAVIGCVLPNSAAAKAGFEAGDRIVRIGNTQSPTWEDVEAQVMLNPGQPLDVAVQRGGQVLTKTIVPDKQGQEEYGALGGWVPQEPNIVTEIEPSMPAAQAGMKVGDEVVAVDGVTMRSMRALISYLQQNPGKPLDVTVLRNGQQLHFNVTPGALAQPARRRAMAHGIHLQPGARGQARLYRRAFQVHRDQQALFAADPGAGAASWLRAKSR